MRIFLSHRGSRQTEADEVAAILRGHGHEVFDMGDWEPGQSFVANMNASLENSDRMIALTCNNYWDSRYCVAEFEAAFTLAHDQRP